MKELNKKTKYLQVFLLALVLIVSSTLPVSADPDPPDLPPIGEAPFVPPDNGFRWKVPNRFGNDDNNDGLIDFHWVIPGTSKYEIGSYQSSYVHPTWFPIYLDGCQTGEEYDSGVSVNTYHWRFLYPEPEVDVVVVGNECRVERGYTTQGPRPVQLTIIRPDGSVFLDSQGRGNPFTQEVVIKDYLIVSIGDSFASGEANPDIEGRLFPEYLIWVVDRYPVWQDTRCGRSAWSGPAQAAMMLERSDPYSSVTFLSFACSGATIDTHFWKDDDPYKPIGTGILGSYRGSELPESEAYNLDSYIPSQIEQVKAAVGSRPIDALIISAGGNDIRFGPIVEQCIKTANCWINGRAREHPSYEPLPLDTLVQNALRALPFKFDLLAEKIDTELNVANVFITEYPDLTPTDNQNGPELTRYCALVDDILPFFQVSPAEAKTAVELALNPLNAQVEAAAGRNDWIFVGGIAAEFRGSRDGKGHGYCASDAWIRRATDSFFMQGPYWQDFYTIDLVSPKQKTKGTLHPTARGHQVYARRLFEEMRPLLMPGLPGDPAPVFTTSLITGAYTSRQGQGGWLTGLCEGDSCTSDRAVLRVNAAAQGAGIYLTGARVAINGVEGCSGVPGISCTTTNYPGSATHSWNFNITQTGTYRLEFMARDTRFVASTFAYEVKVDLNDPTASAVIREETPYHAGWYTSPVEITLAGNDAPGLSGVALVRYNLDGMEDENLPGTTLTIEADGNHSLLFHAVDYAGRQSPQGSLNFQIDQTPPTTTATAVAGSAYHSGSWTNNEVLLTLNSADNQNGSGVSALTYSAIGAQPIDVTADAFGTVELLFSAEGETVVYFSAEDEAGNVEPEQSFTIRIDRTPPGLVCGSADGDWHATDVSIACSASDGGSGFAEGPAATFNLTTNVPAGTETADASTNSMQICDLAGNCVTAGPITGNKVDKKAPDITVSSPTSGSYLLNEIVASSYGCDDQGSGLANCSGTVADGSQIDTAYPGVKVFQVQAADQVGNVSIQEINYNVTYNLCLLYDPGKSYKKGSTVPIRLQLCDAADVNFSDASITLNSVDLVKIDNSASSEVASSGNANPDNNFRYDSDLHGYIYNLSTKDLSTGTWALKFTVTGDPVTHTITFDVK
jgi:lysophospholipase L1-like esterase